MAEKPYIGQMNRVIKIYRTDKVVNEINEHKPVDVLVCQPWAQMKDVNGSQEVEGSIINTVRRSYVIYRNPDVAQTGRQMIVEDGMQRFMVTGMKEIGNTHLELIVENHE